MCFDRSAWKLLSLCQRQLAQPILQFLPSCCCKHAPLSDLQELLMAVRELKHDRVTFKMHYTFSQFLSPIAMHGRSILDVAQVWLACPAAHLRNFEWHPLWIRMWYWNLVEDWCFNAYTKESRLFSEFSCRHILSSQTYIFNQQDICQRSTPLVAFLATHETLTSLSTRWIAFLLSCEGQLRPASAALAFPLRAGIDMLSAWWASAGVLKVKRPYPFDRPSALRWMSTWKGQWMPEASRCKPRILFADRKVQVGHMKPYSLIDFSGLTFPSTFNHFTLTLSVTCLQKLSHHVLMWTVIQFQASDQRPHPYKALWMVKGFGTRGNHRTEPMQLNVDCWGIDSCHGRTRRSGPLRDH